MRKSCPLNPSKTAAAEQFIAKQCPTSPLQARVAKHGITSGSFGSFTKCLSRICPNRHYHSHKFAKHWHNKTLSNFVQLRKTLSRFICGSHWLKCTSCFSASDMEDQSCPTCLDDPSRTFCPILNCSPHDTCNLKRGPADLATSSIPPPRRCDRGS